MAEEMATLVWVDLELTGLDHHKDQIIEVAVVLSDLHCQALTLGPDLVLSTSPELLAGMSPYVQEMHRKSGLTDLVRTSQVNLAQAETVIAQFLQQNQVRNGVIAGSSVHFDRKFLKVGMPGLFEGLIDPLAVFNVSSLKEVSAAWYKHYSAPAKRLQHRSRDDILESIEEYRYYQHTILRLGS